MELWIRSQDKIALTKVDLLKITKKDDETFEIEGLLNGVVLSLAFYKTKERALEVLDDIQNELEKRNLGYPNYTGIYEMPLD